MVRATQNEVTDAEGDEGKNDKGQDAVATRKAPHIAEAHAQNRRDHHGHSAPAQAVFPDEQTEEEEEESVQHPAHGEIAGTEPGPDPGGNEDPVRADGKEDEGPAFERNDEGFAFMTKQ